MVGSLCPQPVIPMIEGGGGETTVVLKKSSREHPESSPDSQSKAQAVGQQLEGQLKPVEARLWRAEIGLHTTQG